VLRKVLSASFLVGLAGLATLTGVAQTPKPAQPPEAKPTPAPMGSGPKTITEDGGQPVGDNQNSRTAGPGGPVTLDNFQLIQKLARFDRERIPQRVVHARGAGAHGEFVSYGDQSKLTKAKLFSAKDKATPVFLRFSVVIHPDGSPEQLRDPRGFSTKFYTEEGNWDLVGNNLPVFFIRDAMKFPDLIHAFKPSPVTNQQDPHRIFDFLSHVPESTHQITWLYSDRGTPANYRQMEGFGVNALKFVNAEGEATYVKFNWRSMQGIKTFTDAEAKADSARNHSGFTEDLYENIKAGKFPSWELGIQVMKPEDLDKFDFNPLDDTKVWTGIEETKIGKMTLNKVPDNFFQFTEQVAFDPGMVVPGIELSEDKMIQGRAFSYADTQRYRLGANYLDLPVNRPLSPVSNINQDGQLNHRHRKGDVNYEPSIESGRRDDEKYEYSKAKLATTVVQQPIEKQLNFKQAGELYESFPEDQKANLVSNLAGDMKKIRDPGIKITYVSFFYRANADYGTRVAKAIGVDLEAVKQYIAKEEKAAEPNRVNTDSKIHIDGKENKDKSGDNKDKK